MHDSNGIEYLNEDLETFPDGSVHDAVLAHDSIIQGLPCAGGRDVVFSPSGRLRVASLSREVIISGICCAPGIVYLYETGTVLNAALSSSLKFRDISVPAGERVTLDEKGLLLEYSHQLNEDQTVDGFPCSAQFRVWLYPSGSLSTAVLASSSVIKGQEFPRGTELFLEEDGQMLKHNQVNLDPGRQYKQRVFGVYEALLG
ncbi:MAG: hypothetical protein K0Q55_1480 [Verrucomicrobia bacterium]|jgi:hypothetical protein|nr:hypothetical protein [Verrucomicrobiota bacterium]